MQNILENRPKEQRSQVRRELSSDSWSYNILNILRIIALFYPTLFPFLICPSNTLTPYASELVCTCR